MKAYKQIALISLISILSACTVGPDYHRPSVYIPHQFKEAKGKKFIGKNSSDWKLAQPKQINYHQPWWKIFGDKKLNNLEDQLNCSNQSIAAAAANYRQAQALVAEVRADFYPTVSGSASFTRQKQSGSTSFISNNTTGAPTTGTASTGVGINRITNTHNIIFNASWEPDIWGLVRRTVEASEASSEASGALLASTRLSAQGSLAQYYFEMRALDTDQKILNETVTSYKKTLQLTKNQYASGVASRADIVQAQSQLEAAEASAINNRINRAIYEHAIAVLIGKPPAALSLSPRPLTATPPPIPIGIPSVILERRPDIAQAERTMAAASAQIGVAVAAYYPTLTLTGSASFFGKGLSHWISMPALGWAYGPQLSQIIYDGGLRSATVAAAEAGYSSTIATYRQTVLAAFQNVEDNLATLRILNAEAVVQNQALASAKLALKLVINQYKSGTVPFSSVITAQIAAFTAEKNAADITGLRMNASVGLILALGGSW